MAFNVEIQCQSSFVSPCDLDKTMERLSNYEMSIGNNFQDLEAFSKEGDGIYLWTFPKLNYGGNQLQIQFRTQFQKHLPDIIKMIPVPSKTKANLSGQWKLTSLKEGTRVDFEATLVGELPLPSLMKSLVAPLAQKEVKKIFDRYIENVAKSF